MDIITLRENYFCCNTYIVKNGEFAVVVDSGVAVKTLQDALEKYGNPQVKAVLLTHAHFDHILSLEDYIQRFNCPVYIHKKGIDNLINPVNNYSAFTDNIIQIQSKNIVSLPKDKKIKIDGFDISYLYTPGHTDDSVCYVIDEVIFTGDTLFDGLIGRTDLANSSADEMLKSLKLLNKEFCYQACFPGHGRKGSGDSVHNYLTNLLENNPI